MFRSFRGVSTLPTALATILILGGCGGEPDAMNDGGAPPGPQAKGSPGLKRIMTALAKGPNSLTPLLGKELVEESPPWETIQGQSKEYARLAAEMASFDPPKGPKESWAKLTADYASHAADLDKAAQAKDKPDALAAHAQLATSCKACHDQHRAMGGGGGGFPVGGPPGSRPGGGPPGFGPPGGGPPPTGDPAAKK